MIFVPQDITEGRCRGCLADAAFVTGDCYNNGSLCHYPYSFLHVHMKLIAENLSCGYYIIFYTEHQLFAQKEEALHDKSLFFDRMMVHLDLSTIIYIILLVELLPLL